MAKIDDVARLANVSKGTVSNVFGKKRAVSEKVQERVLKAAKQLNYTPNHIARSLTTKKTMIIGLKMPQSKGFMLGEFHANLINGVVVTAAQKSYRVLIDTIISENLGLPHTTAEPLDGVIILDPIENDDRITHFYKRNTPLVVIGKPENLNIAEDLPYVDNDNERITFEVCNLLIQKGHKNILFLNAPETRTVAKQRKKGFCKAFLENGIPFEECSNYFKPNKYEDPIVYGYESTLKFFKSNSSLKYTAILTDADKVALGVLRALKDLNKSIPDDVSLIALSNDLTLVDESGPILTTVDLQAFKLGAEAVKLLFEKMDVEEKQNNNKIIVLAKLTEGNSIRSV